MDYWNGYILLVAIGTLIYIVMLHMLPEVYFNEEEDDHDFAAKSSESDKSKYKKKKQEKEEKDDEKQLSQISKFSVLIGGILFAVSILN